MKQITVDTLHGKFPMTPQWRGKHLAVHKYIVGNDGDGPILSSQPKRWQVTHIATGQAVGAYRLWECTLKTVLQLALMWDDAFSEIDPKKAREWDRYEEWIQACALTKSSGVPIPPRPRK